MMQCVFVLVELALNRAKLQMTFAKIPQLEELLGNAKLFGAFDL